MAEMLSVAEAKRRFSELIERVGQGERFVVTRRDKPVLALVPPEDETAEYHGGQLALVGTFAGWDDLPQFVEEVYRDRRRSRSRTAPKFD